MSTATSAARTRRTPSKDADVELGARAHMLIWRSGRSQESVANALGIEATGFGKKLKGKRGWALQEVKDLAAELGTTASYLIGESDDPGPNFTAPNKRPTDYMAAGSEALVIDITTRQEIAS